MKTMTRIFAIAAMMIAFAASSFAQVNATASASATIVTPIAIVKTVDMNFGNVAVNSTTAGTVVLSTAGSRTYTGGVTLPANTGTVTAAEFDVTGAANYTYSITLSDVPVTVTDGTNNMVVNTFVTNPTPTGILDGSGEQTIKVGATLNVGAAQAAGAYTSTTPFKVTVNYN